MILPASKAANETAMFKLDHSYVIVFTLLYEYIQFSKTNKVDSGAARISRGGRGWEGGRRHSRRERYANLLFCNFFVEHCIKIKQFGSREGSHVPGAPLE